MSLWFNPIKKVIGNSAVLSLPFHVNVNLLKSSSNLMSSIGREISMEATPTTSYYATLNFLSILGISELELGSE